MNPIALIETTAATRSAVQGALATDPVAPRATGRSTRRAQQRDREGLGIRQRFAASRDSSQRSIMSSSSP
jgi:hypothetical protein